MKVNRILAVVAGAALAAGIAACGGSANGDGGLEVSSQSFEAEERVWPFWPESGTLHCDDGAVYFRPQEGGEYAVNGVAVETGQYSDPNSIRLESQGGGESDLSGQASMNDMIEVGEELC